MDYEARREAEREIDARRGVNRGPIFEHESSSEARSEEPPRKIQAVEDAVTGYEEPYNLENFNCPLREWLQQPQTQKEICHRFDKFLHNFQEEKGTSLVYYERIKKMCNNNEQSLEVNMEHLVSNQSVLGVMLADEPEQMLELFNKVLKEVVLTVYPSYMDIHSDLYVRITHLYLDDNIRDLRQEHLGGLIKVSGVVTRRTIVYPQLLLILFTCNRCGYNYGPVKQEGNKEITITHCPQCHSKGTFRVNSEKTLYRNYQRITLQESPSSVPAGRVPRRKDVILQADLIDRVRPGEEVVITGIYTHQYSSIANIQSGFPVFNTIIVANHIARKDDIESMNNITEDDKKQIIAISKDKNLENKLLESIAPSIYGHKHTKLTLLLSLFGGVPKTDDNHKIRGDINILLLGDPGTAKSQFLKYAQRIAPRAIYTTGKGASAVGLTASVHRDVVTREWTLEGGALVLADQGVCLIDEFDKMSDNDRVSIHEAMEQQSISISKAGIVTTLQARCAVIAAANPVEGRYDQSKTLSENITLSDPIIQRFDMLCVMRDIVDPVQDEQMGNFIIDSHIDSHPSKDQSDHRSTDGTINQDLLRKYILYARTYCKPSLEGADTGKVEKLYTELRKASDNVGGIPIAVRHLESIIRMSEAHAKMYLRDHVNDYDIDIAISLLLESFINSQKYSVMKTLKKTFNKYISSVDDTAELLLYVLQTMMREAQTIRNLKYGGAKDDEIIEIDLNKFEKRANELDIHNVQPFLSGEVFQRNRFTYDSKNRKILREP